MEKIPLIFLCTLIFSSTFSWAEIDRLENKKFHLKVASKPIGYEMYINNRGNSKDPIKYVPNLDAQLSVGFNFEGFIGLSWGFRAKDPIEERLKKGETDYQDWRFSIPSEKYRVTAYFVKYKGFYIENSQDVDSSWNPSGPYVRDEKLYNQSTGGSLTWIHQPENFSLVAMLDQNDRQLKSGGSWLYGVSMNETFFKSDDPIIPAQVQARYGEDALFEFSRFRSLILHAGYGYTYVPFESFTLSGAGQVGQGPQEMLIEGDGFARKRLQLATVADIQLNAGYNGPDWFTGLTIQAHQIVNKARSIQISSNMTEVQLYLGVHL